MRSTSIGLICAVWAFAFCAEAEAIDVSGAVATTTWLKTNSPYRVINTVTVPAGNTLTIEPGVDVLFDADVQFVVQGNLRALGTSTDSVRFLKGAASNWRGVRITSGSASVFSHVRISGSFASGGTAPHKWGGGLYVSDEGTRVELSNCVISGNKASYDGGGVLNNLGATLIMEGCIVSSNVSLYSDGGGLGTYNNAVLEMTNCRLEGNSSSTGNGGGLLVASVARLTDCALNGNVAAGDGGGIQNFGVLTMTGCTVYRNAAANGGGVSNFKASDSHPGTLVMVNCTMYGNTASTSGNGIYNYNSGTSSIKNSIVWQNGQSNQVSVSTGSASVTYSDIQGGFAGTGNIDADPLFVDASANDFRLQPGSPCIGTGEAGADMGAFPFPRTSTEVKGSVTTQTWGKADSPYRVTGTITVPTGNTLTVEPGVNVLFDSTAQFIVQGSLHAVGTATDSIRFLKGEAEYWGGIRVSGGDSSTLAFVRISGGNANSGAVNDFGGALFVDGSATRVTMSNTVISGNTASNSGGGVRSEHGTLRMTDCTISHNTALYGGGILNFAGTLEMTNCVVRDNSATLGGGGVRNGMNGTLAMTRCSLFGNSADIGGGLRTGGNATLTNCTLFGNMASDSGAGITSYGNTTLLNTIVWGNTGREQIRVGQESVAAAFSDIQGDTLWAGEGNINADPLFVNAAAGDFRLRAGSPCIGTGEAGADMGACAAIPSYSMYLPALRAGAGATVTVPIRASVETAYSAEVVFTVNRAYVAPGSPFVVSHAFEGKQSVSIASSMQGDTVFVMLSAAEPITLFDQPLVTLRFAVSSQTPINTIIPISWVPSLTFFNESPAMNLGDGSLTATALYGDVSGDGILSTLDASQILQYLVRIRPVINSTIADVTNNGRVSAFDAAWILVKVLDPDRLFPCEGGEPLPGTKPAVRAPIALLWERTGAGWALAASDATGVMAGDLVLTLADDSPVTLSGDGLTAFRQDGTTLFVSFVRTETGAPTLLSLATSSGAPPQIIDISLNEGAIPTTFSAPVAFSLSQNTPNPFNPSTTLRFGLPEAGHVRLAVYDVTGALVRTLVDGRVEAGMRELVWDGRDSAGRAVASGVYVYRLTTAQGQIVRRMVLVR